MFDPLMKSARTLSSSVCGQKIESRKRLCEMPVHRQVITANYVPVNTYHDLFYDAVHARVLLRGSQNMPVVPILPPPSQNQNMPLSNGYEYGMMPGHGALPGK